MNLTSSPVLPALRRLHYGWAWMLALCLAGLGAEESPTPPPKPTPGPAADVVELPGTEKPIEKSVTLPAMTQKQLIPDEDDLPAPGPKAAPRDEARPKPKPLADGPPGPDDPEFPRVTPDDGPALTLDALRPKAPTRLPSDSPRFVMGQGLDDLKADEILAPPKPAPEPSVAKENPKRPVKPRLPNLPTRPKHKPGEVGDPDKEFQELLDSVKQQNQAMAEAFKTSGAADLSANTPERQAERLLEELHARPLGLLKGKIIDPRTKQLVAARVKVTDDSGLLAGASLPDAGFWCDGSFAIPVMSGPVRIEVSGGRFRSTFLKVIEVPANQAVEVLAALAGPNEYNFAAQGWYTADLNLGVYANKGERPIWSGEDLTPVEASLIARAEGVQVLALSKPWGGEADSATEEQVRAALDELQEPGYVVLPAVAAPRNPFCGSALGIGMEKWNDFPPFINDPKQPLRDYFDDIRARNGLAVFTDLHGRRSAEIQKELLPIFPTLKNSFYKTDDQTAVLYGPAELPFDTVTGVAYDALAYDNSEQSRMLWFTLLNMGYRIPIVPAGEGSLEGGHIPGASLLINVSGELSADGVIKACRKGASVLTWGPAAFVKIVERDKGPGEHLPSDGRQLTLQVRAFAALDQESAIETIEVIRNGEVVQSERQPSGLTSVQDFRYPLQEGNDAWYCVRVTERLTKSRATRIALSNPIYFESKSRLAPQPMKTRYSGVLTKPGGTPMPGRVTILEPGEEKRTVEIGPSGKYSVTLNSAGALIFDAPGYTPAARRPFTHPDIQSALGELHAQRKGALRTVLTTSDIFERWRYLLLDLHENIEIVPSPPHPKPKPTEEPPELPKAR